MKCCGDFEMESLVFMHCIDLKMGITLSFLRLKLWGLLCDMVRMLWWMLLMLWWCCVMFWA